MRKEGGIIIAVSGGLFLLFFANVVAGSLGLGGFLSDIQEMLILFVACIFFVIGILYQERAAKSRSSHTGTQ